ncbi:MAG: cytochrome c [Alphaproteobacteria bacterium]|nr:cytochrome c [Alphaproteobacteria bacterium]
MRQTILAASLVLASGAALAQSPEDALEARHGLMKMISIEMGTLSGMAKGEVEYDEAAATAAATNLMALAQYDAPKLFIEGTSSEDIQGSDALPAIWSNRDDFEAKFAALTEATAGIDQAVAGGQANVGPVVQQLGLACRDCHQSYRMDR